MLLCIYTTFRTFPIVINKFNSLQASHVFSSCSIHAMHSSTPLQLSQTIMCNFSPLCVYPYAFGYTRFFDADSNPQIG